MDSITEEELLQMVRDFIESESASPISAPSSKALSHNDQLPYLALQVCVRIDRLQLQILLSQKN